MQFLRPLLGVGVWAAAVAALWLAADRRMAHGDLAGDVAPQLWRYVAGRRTEVRLRLPAPAELAVGDPIFHVQAGSVRRVGQVEALLSPAGEPPADRGVVAEARALLLPGGPTPRAGDALVYYAAPDSLDWVMDTLLTDERRAAIAERLSAAWRDNQDEIVAAFTPLVERSLRDGLRVAQAALPESIERHRGEWEALAAAYQREIVEEDLVPLAQEELWPILRGHAEPALRDVGREVWDRVSLWRFGWRFAYDAAVSPDEPLVDAEWNRFVADELEPVLQAHSQEFVDVVEATVRDASANPRVRQTVRDGLRRVAEDRRFQSLLRQTAREVLVENRALREALLAPWRGPEAGEAFRLASARLEPALRAAADEIIGSPEEGITPEFALVLRHQILAKDRRWLVLEQAGRVEPAARGADAAGVLVLPVRFGGTPPHNPFLEGPPGAD
jgi:hypothetical protein